MKYSIVPLIALVTLITLVTFFTVVAFIIIYILLHRSVKRITSVSYHSLSVSGEYPQSCNKIFNDNKSVNYNTLLKVILKFRLVP